MGKSNILHKPLLQFFYGSLAVIMLALSLGAYYLSDSFLQNEKKRAEISSVQVSESLGSEHRYIVEEFFTSSYESIFIRVTNALQKFGSPIFELYLFNNAGECLLARNHKNEGVTCPKDVMIQEGRFLYSTDLKLGTTRLGEMKVLVEDRFQFFTGSTLRFAFKLFFPIFLSVITLWGIWALLSRKFILIPYYKKMMTLEKEKVSTDIIRQIIHDTKGEIAALDLYTYELEDQQKAEEMRKALHNIRESFGNLSHHKEGIVTTVREIPANALGLFNDFIEQQKIKYKRHAIEVSITNSFSAPLGHKIRVDANTFYRVLSNLIENSVTAKNSEGKIEINVTFSETQNTVLISISDNGDGIEDEAHEKLFIKGFTTKETGSGQGLSFVKKTVEGWGGKVHFATKIDAGRGTVFTIEVPAFFKPKIVILDDNTSLLFRYKKMIERYGYQVEVYSDTTSFIDNSQFFERDTIFLLDFNLSDNTNGAEVAQKLSEIGMNQIFLHTGNPSIDKTDYPFVKDILSKGNFLDTMGRLGITVASS